MLYWLTLSGNVERKTTTPVRKNQGMTAIFVGTLPTNNNTIELFIHEYRDIEV